MISRRSRTRPRGHQVVQCGDALKAIEGRCRSREVASRTRVPSPPPSRVDLDKPSRRTRARRCLILTTRSRPGPPTISADGDEEIELEPTIQYPPGGARPSRRRWGASPASLARPIRSSGNACSRPRCSWPRPIGLLVQLGLRQRQPRDADRGRQPLFAPGGADRPAVPARGGRRGSAGQRGATDAQAAPRGRVRAVPGPDAA